MYTIYFTQRVPDEGYRKMAESTYAKLIPAQCSMLDWITSDPDRAAEMWADGKRLWRMEYAMRPADIAAVASLPETTRGARIKTINLSPYLTAAVRAEVIARWKQLTGPCVRYKTAEVLAYARPLSEYRASKLTIFKVICDLHPWDGQ